MPHDFSCYHIDDEYSFTDEDVPTSAIERDLIQSVDHVIVHSKALLEKKGKINPNTTLVHNGVAFDAFARPRPEPADLAPVPHPRIGYVGYLKRQLDWQLLAGLTRRHRDWSFVFVGPVAPHPDTRAVLEELGNRSNVHLLGAKDVLSLGAYPQHFDVCTMPYRLTADADYIFPLKLHEYLASGRPIIATPIASLEDFTSVVSVAKTLDEWSLTISRTLHDSGTLSSEAVERRREIARHYDWDLLVDGIVRIMAPAQATISQTASGVVDGEPAAVATALGPAVEDSGLPAEERERQQQTSLDRSFTTSLAWTTGGKWIAQLIGWLSTIIVARLLSPGDYGLIGMATVYLALIALISEFGLGTAVVTLKTLTPSQIAQLNTLSVLIGLGSMALSWALASPVGLFFETPDLGPVIMAMSLGFLITAFRVVPQALIQRDLQFKVLAYLDVGQTLTLAVIMVLLAALGFRYWTLVIGSLASGAISTLVLVTVRPHRFAIPRRTDLVSAMTFSWQVIWARIGWYVQVHSDFFVAGKFLGQQALGFYNLAWSLATVPVEKISAIVMRVAPAFLAAVQTSLPTLRRYVLGLTEAIGLVALPAAFGLALVADDFVSVAFGPKWAGAALPLQLLALHAAFQAVAPLMTHVLAVTGETRFAMWANLGAATVLPLGFYAGSRWGPGGIAMVWVLVYPVVFMPIYRRTLRRIELPVTRYLAVLRPAAMGCAAMVVAVTACRMLVVDERQGLRLALQILVGIAAYLAVIMGPYRRRTTELFRFVREGLRRESRAPTA